jgi:aspartate racemase
MQTRNLKKLGLIGGISWHTTAQYYSIINNAVSEKMGGLNGAPCIIHSFNMADIEVLMKAEDHAGVLRLFTNAGMSMKRDGAQGLVICANTMHMFAEQITASTGLPVIHLVTATARAIIKEGHTIVALLGTRPTMDLGFYTANLAAHGIQTLLPDEQEKDFIHDSIFSELSRGVFTEETRKRYLGIMDRLVDRGARGIVLGCTDIPPLLKDHIYKVPLFDTTHIHAQAAADFCLG